jgi:hypothetical protein
VSVLLVFSVLIVSHVQPQDHGLITNVFAQLTELGMVKIASALLDFSVPTVFHVPPQDHGLIINVFARLLWSGMKHLLIVFVLKEH